VSQLDRGQKLLILTKLSTFSLHVLDPAPLVSLPALQKAYDSLTAKTSALEESEIHPDHLLDFQGDQVDVEELTVDSHFKVVGAFDMPGWRFDSVKGTFGL
jgi:hypothetical protein